ncbi:MAG: hypothetical protein AB7G39_11135 [Alphaproteobacteria bacterium]
MTDGQRRQVVVFGVSNMLDDVFDCILALGHRVARVVTNHPETLRPRTRGAADRIARLPEPPDLLALDDYRPQPGEMHVLGTTSPARESLVELLAGRHGILLATLVHPAAYVSPLARLGAGGFVGAGSVVAPGCEIGPHVFVNRAASIGHDCTVEAYARIQPGCHIGGHVRIGRGAEIGIGACIVQERHIGAGARVAAGAVVARDVAAGESVAGAPARRTLRMRGDAS